MLPFSSPSGGTMGNCTSTQDCQAKVTSDAIDSGNLSGNPDRKHSKGELTRLIRLMQKLDECVLERK